VLDAQRSAAPEEFARLAINGNLVALAVGVIIGGAFVIFILIHAGRRRVVNPRAPAV
jgi:large-conductance mechanosensitive channel